MNRGSGARPPWAEGRWVDSRMSPWNPYRKWVEMGPAARWLILAGLAITLLPWSFAHLIVAVACVPFGLIVVLLGFSHSTSTDGPHRWAVERQERVYPDDDDRMPGQYEQALSEALAESGVHDVDPAAFAVLSAATRTAFARLWNRFSPAGSAS